MDWTEVKPVLEATYRLLDGGAEQTTPAAVCAALGQSDGDQHTFAALARLYKTNYIDGFVNEESPTPVRIGATEKGLQVARGWPANPGVDPLLAALDQKISDPTTPEDQRGRLRRVRDALTEVAPRIIGGILVDYTARMIPPSG